MRANIVILENYRKGHRSPQRSRWTPDQYVYAVVAAVFWAMVWLGFGVWIGLAVRP